MAKPASSRCNLDCRHCFYNDTAYLSVTVNRQNSRWPKLLYQQLRQSGASLLQFIPLMERDEHGILTVESVEPQVWGTFLTTVFDIWVREDIGRVHVRLFDVVLNEWCGYSRHEEKTAVSPDCQRCTVLRFCHGDCPKHRDESGKSVLCAGYSAFIDYTAPHMRVMRDLIRQHRSPTELMAMLRTGR